MKDPAKEFEKSLKLIKESQNILIISHRNPDGDTIGSNLTIRYLLENEFNKTVTSLCIDSLPESLEFLLNGYHFEHSANLKEFDLIIIVDCSSLEQAAFKIPKNAKVLNIDHHASNIEFGTVNLVNSEAASTTEIIYELFEYLNITLTPHQATCLLGGLYTDTGSFMHSNTNARSYEISAKLLKAGACLQKIIKYMFRTKTIEQLKLWGKVLSNARINKHGSLITKVTETDYKETNSNPRDLTGVVNYLSAVPNCKMSILLAEDTKGNVRGSIRTADSETDVADICQQLGGGGHKKAAGFTIPGKIVSEEVWRIEE